MTSTTTCSRKPSRRSTPTLSVSYTAMSSRPASPRHGRDPSCHTVTSHEPAGEQPHQAALFSHACLPVLADRRAVEIGCSVFCGTQVLELPCP
jgi:hypothetical protein